MGFDYFCFHDIDMLPEDDTCDYSWVDKPTHLASRLSKFNYRLVYPEYFSGVTLFNKEHFEWINGLAKLDRPASTFRNCIQAHAQLSIHSPSIRN